MNYSSAFSSPLPQRVRSATTSQFVEDAIQIPGRQSLVLAEIRIILSPINSKIDTAFTLYYYYFQCFFDIFYRILMPCIPD